MEHKFDISDVTNRRLSTLARHLEVSTMESSVNEGLYASITSGFDGNSNSVFAHVVKAPEDPILGVKTLSPIFIGIKSCNF